MMMEISKEYLDSVYRACHVAQMEVKSEEREKHREGEEFLRINNQHLVLS
jgi:hypothetical protein